MLTFPRLFALEIHALLTSQTQAQTEICLFYFHRWLKEKEIHPNSDFSLLTAKKEKKGFFLLSFFFCYNRNMYRIYPGFSGCSVTQIAILNHFQYVVASLLKGILNKEYLSSQSKTDFRSQVPIYHYLFENTTGSESYSQSNSNYNYHFIIEIVINSCCVGQPWNHSLA